MTRLLVMRGTESTVLQPATNMCVCMVCIDLKSWSALQLCKNVFIDTLYPYGNLGNIRKSLSIGRFPKLQAVSCQWFQDAGTRQRFKTARFLTVNMPAPINTRSAYLHTDILMCLSNHPQQTNPAYHKDTCFYITNKTVA